MAFFNKTTSSQSASVNDAATAQPLNGTQGVTAPANSDASHLEFVSRANDTFQENYQKDLNLNQNVQVSVDPNGVKSVTPFQEPTPTAAPAPVEPSITPTPSLNLQPMQNITEPMATDTMPQLPTQGLDYATYTLDQILTESIKAGASDVHFVVGYRVMIRVDGTLRTFKSSILTPEVTVNYAKQFLNKRVDLKLEDIKESDLTYAIGARRFRINIYKQMGSYSIACRVIPERISNLEDLNLPPILKEFTKFPNGLVLVTGPTGSGKSTTIASILNNINLTQPKHITSIEDPVEYVFPKAISIIDQREFGVDFTSWTTALRSVLRQDPDIVFLGEMRDFDSIEAALQIADTGHLVFATLHTNGAAQSIDRIIDVFPAERQAQIRIQLSSVLRAVVSQRLVTLATSGRTPVAEILIANPAVTNAIRDKKVFLIDNIIQTSSDEGMVSMEKSLAELVKRGVISITTAKNLSLRPKEIDILIHQ